MDSLLVLTGVSRAADLLVTPPSARPTYVAHDLRGLFDAGTVVRLDDLPTPQGNPLAVAGDGWELTLDGVPTLTGAGRALDALRLLCACAWSGHPVGAVRPGSDAAGTALGELGLTGGR